MEELDSTPKAGEYSARHLRIFTPREGTELVKIQKELEGGVAEEEGNGEMEEVVSTGREEPDSLGEGEPTGLDSDELIPQDIEERGETDKEDSSIGSRVAGCCRSRQNNGGGWNR